MQPHVLAVLHVQRCGVVLDYELRDKLTTEVVHGECLVADALQYYFGF
jgi:hypothetical protein